LARGGKHLSARGGPQRFRDGAQMSDLKIRRIPFDLEGVEFIWNPDDPVFSIWSNNISFLAVGFEKYICQAMAEAEALIKDPAVLEEARRFRMQEGLHSAAHRLHVKALAARYPGIETAMERCIAFYDDLYSQHDLKYHIGYVAGLESIFTPSFKLLLDNKEALYAKGDVRVSSLFLWHFCEEIEHRSSALIIYNHVCRDYFYRLSHFKEFMLRSKDVLDIIAEEFRKTFPDMPEEWFTADYRRNLPKKQRKRAERACLMAQAPWHNPRHEALPAYYAEWSEKYDGGEDVRRIYGTELQTGLAEPA
jgi:hypothetical protein